MTIVNELGISQNIRFKAFRNVSKQLSLSLRRATPDWFQKSLRKRLYDLYNALSMPGSRLSHRCMSILDIWCSVYVPSFRLPTSRSTGSWLVHHMYWSEWPIYFYSVGTLLNIPYVTQRFLYYMSIHISTRYSFIQALMLLLVLYAVFTQCLSWLKGSRFGYWILWD